MSEPKYTVGQEVWVRNVNAGRRGPQRGTVVKVGRVLVQVEVYPGHWTPYRIETGYKNDEYYHEWIQTDEEYAETEARAAAHARIKDLHVRFDLGTRRLTAKTLNAIADLVEAEEEPKS